MSTERLIFAGPVVNCLDRSVYPYAGREGWACPRCGGYHNANGEPLLGPCPTDPRCVYISKSGGRPHDGLCSKETRR